MKKNIYFVYNKENGEYEFYVNGELITDCFSNSGEVADLILQLNKFADVPIYQAVDVKKLDLLRRI